MSEPILSAWPPLPPGAWLPRADGALPFPLEHEGCRWFARARHALWHGAGLIGLGAGDEVLAPAYHHGSEIEALARAGVSCRFYAGDPRLAPDPDELEALLGPRVRGLLLIHYLGFPQDARRWRSWCDEHGLLLLEDAAQAWLAQRDGDPAGAHGDLAIFCLYKTVGVPDGAALLAPRVAAAPAPAGHWGATALARRHAAWLAGRSAAAGWAYEALRPRRAYDPEQDFALGEPAGVRSRSTAVLLPRLADSGVAAARRARYAFLLEQLGERVPAPFERIRGGASPFAFPVETDDKPRLLERLARHGVDALDFWSQPHGSLPAGAFPAAATRRARTLALPVHQELRPSDLERIVAAVRGPARARAELRIEPIDDLERARDEWTHLAEQVGDPFATWEWATSWCRHLLGGRPLHLIACRRPDGRLAGILPLYESGRRPLRLLRFLGSGPADRQGPICLAADRGAVARALRRALTDRLRCDVLLAERLPGECGWSAFLPGRTVRREASPVLRIEGRSWDELLAARSANFRQQVRARERRLSRGFTLSYRLAEDPELVAGDLATLIDLHEARWSGGGSDAFAGARRGFHVELATRALRRGWLRLWFLELDGEPVAAWYGFRYGGADWFYQAGRDPRRERLSAGFVLMAHTVREAARDGMRAYHLLRGDEHYKARFAREDPGLDTIGVACGAAGRAAVAAAVLAAAAPPGGRRVLTRLAER
jgi:CelD/BcsL family acetyltransferase involved in cellulose biosynthesis